MSEPLTAVEPIKGEIVSYCVMHNGYQASYSDSAGAFDGYRVLYRYVCPCNQVHDCNAQNVWPTGESNVDTIIHVCPITKKQNTIELTKPRS